MPRRGPVKKRQIPPDPKYGNVWVHKLINKVMWDGKKSKAEKIVYKAFELIEKEMKKNPVEVFEQAVENVRPLVEVRPRRVGGATYQIPIEIDEERSKKKAIMWIVQSAREREGRPMYERLAAEIMAAYRGEGASIKKKEALHKTAEANRAFVHYRW